MAKREAILILDNIRSTYNVGAIFRTADAGGISKIYLAGYTPAPLDRFGRKRKDIAKSALGAEESMPWESVQSTEKLIKKLKKQKYKIIAIEQSENSIDYKKVKIDPPKSDKSDRARKTAFILGTEVTGLPKKILSLCDIVAEIPMKGEKESLNVSVAFGVAIFRMLGI